MLIDKELDQLYKEAAEGQKRGQNIGGIRTFFAYFLKAIAAGGSLIVATGLFPLRHQVIGIAILLAIFVDTISSNHERLIAEVQAGYAFRSLQSSVRAEFNRKASPLYAKLKNNDNIANEELEKVQKQLETLKHDAHLKLYQGIEIIRKKLEKTDIKALRTLSLDQERASLKDN